MYVLGPNKLFEAPVAILLKKDKYEDEDGPLVKDDGVLWKRGDEGWMNARCQDWCIGINSCVGLGVVDPLVGGVVFVLLVVEGCAPSSIDGGMKYLIVLASGSSSLAPVRDCMYFFSGSRISAI